MENNIEQLLKPYLNSPIECDGFTRIAYSVLANNSIYTQGYAGHIMYVPKKLNIFHFWLELPDGRLIDYRAKMWFSNLVKETEIPHGVFEKSSYPNFNYSGNLITLNVLSEKLINFLCL